jgi:1-acyl-sn-glycerol-3-phosphate acyltransferase
MAFPGYQYIITPGLKFQKIFRWRPGFCYTKGEMLRTLHSIFFYLITALSFFIGSVMAMLGAPLAKSKTNFFQDAARAWARFLIIFSGVKVSCFGLENVPRQGPVIIACNHQGAADILVLLAYLPVRFRFAIKKELFRIPFFGGYLKKAGYFPIDREMILSAYRTVETMAGFLQAGDSILIFPEGTRSRTGELGRFKRGSLLAAQKSGAPILPVAISGSFHILPTGTWRIHPCPVKLSVGKPIHIKDENDYNGKVEEVRDAIARML